jgi:hypothetical protein
MKTRRERQAALARHLEEELARIPAAEVRPVAETRRLLLLAGVRAYNAGTVLRADLPAKTIDGTARFVGEPRGPESEPGRLLTFERRSGRPV